MYQTNRSNSSTLFTIFPAAVLAALTTFSLILLMQQLIHRDFSVTVEGDPEPFPDVVIVERNPPEPRFELAVKPEPVENPPEMPVIAKHSPSETQNAMPLPVIEFSGKKIKIDGAGGSFPISQVFSSPRYPERALARGIEGWVDLRFDVSAHGTTENIQILHANPEGYFEKAAIKAAQKWRYQPFTDAEGNPKTFEGIQKRLVFEIEKKD